MARRSDLLLLDLREDAGGEALAEARQRALDAADVDDVAADAEDHALLLARRFRARLVHEGAHAADGAVEAAEDRLADEEMADVELGDGGDGGDRPHRVEGQAVAGMAFEAERLGLGARPAAGGAAAARARRPAASQ